MHTPINDISSAIIGAAIEVHRALGPGLLESAYEQCLAHELSLREIPFERQKPLSLDYKGIRLDCGYRLDFLVANLVVVEIKAIEALLPIHQAQLLSYLKLGGWKLGLLINFHAPLLREGIKRVVLGLEEVPKSTTSDA
ncbi:MAG: GxxExxY protein [Acidobacteria bacterium]|nr:GxxExxY protein [Acidobacteriota bacterium]